MGLQHFKPIMGLQYFKAYNGSATFSTYLLAGHLVWNKNILADLSWLLFASLSDIDNSCALPLFVDWFSCKKLASESQNRKQFYILLFNEHCNIKETIQMFKMFHQVNLITYEQPPVSLEVRFSKFPIDPLLSCVNIDDSGNCSSFQTCLNLLCSNMPFSWHNTLACTFPCSFPS